MAACARCVKSAQLFFFRPFGGKPDAADPFLIVPRSSFEICAKRVKSGQRSFFEPSGGKSDAADPFLIVPSSSFEICGRHVSRCLGGNREAKSIWSPRAKCEGAHGEGHTAALQIMLAEATCDLQIDFASRFPPRRLEAKMKRWRLKIEGEN